MKNLKKKNEMRKYKRLFIISVILIDLTLIVLSYILMPKVQNFPPYSESINFQKEVQPLTHIQEYAYIFFIGVTLHLLVYKIVMRNIDKYIKKYINEEKMDYEFILKIRKSCNNIPYIMLWIQFTMFIIIGIVLNLIMLVEVNAIIKFTLMIIAVVSLISLSSFIVTERYLYKISRTTYLVNDNYEKNNGFRIKIHTSLLLQSFPLILAMLIVPTLLGYANTVTEKGKGNSDYYKAYIDNQEIDSNKISIPYLKEVLNKIPLKQEGDYYFIISPRDEEIYVSNKNGQISNFTLKYRDYFFNETEGMLYEKFGTEEQLFAKKLVDNKNQVWYIGFKFSVANTSLLINDIIIISAVLLVALVFLFIWAKNFNKNAESISVRLKEILKSPKIEKENIIPILSNDELGDLSYYYNKIQEKLINQEDIIALQSKFSAIGEVAAGMAHDINNPASAIEGSVELLYDFEPKEVEDKEEYKKLLDNMKIAINRILSIVNNAREQFRNFSNLQKEHFTLNKLFESIKQSENDNVTKAGCMLIINKSDDINVYGVKSKLDQVITNIIRNAVDAYKDNNLRGNIEINSYVDEKDPKYGIISIKDSAGGIPEEIRSTLLKKIITTRGVKGTGLGLYLSSNIIRGDFGGDITFDTKKGKGTTFYVRFLINKEEN